MNDVTKRAVIVAAVVLGLFSLVRAVSYFQGDPFDMAHDLIIDHVAGRAILEGEDPYQSVLLMQQEYLPESARHEAGRAAVDLPNWHTPTRLLLHLPLAKLSFSSAGIIWTVISAWSIAGALYLFGRELGWSRLGSLALGIGALGTPLVHFELSLGQVQGPLLLATVLAWRYLRRGRDAFGGAWLGLAAGIKLYPAFLVLPLILKRRYRLIGWAAITGGMVLVAAWFGVGAPNSWFSALLDFGDWKTSPWNASWQGLVLRVSPSLGWLAWAGTAVLTLLALRPPNRLTGDTFWSSTLLMVLALPVGWSTYALLVLPWIALAFAAADSRTRLFLVVPAALILLSTPESVRLMPLALLACVAIECSAGGAGVRRDSDIQASQPQLAN